MRKYISINEYIKDFRKLILPIFEAANADFDQFSVCRFGENWSILDEHHLYRSIYSTTENTHRSRLNIPLICIQSPTTNKWALFNKHAAFHLNDGGYDIIYEQVYWEHPTTYAVDGIRATLNIYQKWQKP